MSGERGPGRVILVGAGPGAADLVTLRGLTALRGADAVVYDALASHELLAEAPPGALRIDVGKRGHEAPTRSQQEINALLVALAREGRTVVRLKGGDPFVFGRGGEELSALAAAGIPFEVVPGVSSPIGALAAAGIPVTDRRFAASFAVVTGHKDPSKPREEIRWAGLARSADTLLVLMGMRNLAEIVERLLAGGRDPATPAAVVMDATLPTQRVVEAPLAELPARVREAGLRAPAVIVIGEVVRLRESLARPGGARLAGRRVWVTRAAHQAGPWLEALRAAGAEPVLRPLIEIEPLESDAMDAALEQLPDFDWLVFASANAVEALARAAEARQRPLAGGFRVACVGEATAAAARARGLPVTLVPRQRRDAEGLLEALRAGGELAGRRVLLPRAEAAREALPAGLRSAGVELTELIAYRTRAARIDVAALRAELRGGALDALSFASPSAVHALDAVLDEASRAAARGIPTVAIGASTAEALARIGLPADAVPTRPDAESLIEALAALLPAVETGEPEEETE